MSITDSTTLTVPPMTTMNVQIVALQSKIDVKFRYSVECMYTDGSVHSSAGEDGVYRNVESYRTDVRTTEEPSGVTAGLIAAVPKR
jgi:hypothetical protein